jgi:hypothetical protein
MSVPLSFLNPTPARTRCRLQAARRPGCQRHLGDVAAGDQLGRLGGDPGRALTAVTQHQRAPLARIAGHPDRRAPPIGRHVDRQHRPRRLFGVGVSQPDPLFDVKDPPALGRPDARRLAPKTVRIQLAPQPFDRLGRRPVRVARVSLRPLGGVVEVGVLVGGKLDPRQIVGFARQRVRRAQEEPKPRRSSSAVDRMRLPNGAKDPSVTEAVRDAGATVEGDPKSEKSRRTLPLPDRLVSVLRSVSNTFEQRFSSSGVEPMTSHGADDGADDGNRTRVFSLGSRFGVFAGVHRRPPIAVTSENTSV